MKQSTLRPSSRRILAVVTLLAASSHAATETWIGNTSANFNDSNWAGSNNPPISFDSFVFGPAGLAGANLNNNLAPNFTARGIAFMPSASSFTFSGNAMTLAGDVANNSFVPQTINFDLNLVNTREFQTTGGGGDLLINGTLSGAGTISKESLGTLLLTSSANSYRGETILSGGVLNVASLSDYGVPSAIGARALEDEDESVAGVGLHFRGGVLQYTGSTPQSTNRNVRFLNGDGGGIDASGSTPESTVSFTHTGPIINLFDTPGARTFTLTGANAGDNRFSIQLTDQDGNPTGLIKDGPGRWILNGPDANLATGATKVLGGTLVLGKTAAAAVSGPLNIGTGTVPAAVVLAGTGGNQISDSSEVSLSGLGAAAGILRLNGRNETIGGLSNLIGGIVENEGGVPGTATLTVNVAAGFQSFYGEFRDGNGAGVDGTLAMTKTGAGGLALFGTSSHTGPTTVMDGILRVEGSLSAETNVTVANGRVDGSGLIAGSVSLAAGGVLASTGTIGGSVTINAGILTGGSTINGLATAAAQGRIEAINTTFHFNGGLIGNGEFTFGGGGLSAIHGNVTNNVGGLISVVGASTATFYGELNNMGDVAVGQDSRLVLAGDAGGAGNFTGGGMVEVANDFAPGNGEATVGFENVTFANSSALRIELGGQLPGEFDQLDIRGNGTLGGNLLVEFLPGFTPDVGDQFEILNIAGSRTGVFANVAEGAVAAVSNGLAFAITYAGDDGNDVVLYAQRQADFFPDGLVDGLDLQAWKSGFGIRTGAQKADGDYDNDGNVDGADFLGWQREIGLGSGPASAALPEPSSWLGAAVVAFWPTLRKYYWGQNMPRSTRRPSEHPG